MNPTLTSYQMAQNLLGMTLLEVRDEIKDEIIDTHIFYRNKRMTRIVDLVTRQRMLTKKWDNSDAGLALQKAELEWETHSCNQPPALPVAPSARRPTAIIAKSIASISREVYIPYAPAILYDYDWGDMRQTAYNHWTPNPHRPPRENSWKSPKYSDHYHRTCQATATSFLLATPFSGHDFQHAVDTTPPSEGSYMATTMRKVIEFLRDRVEFHQWRPTDPARPTGELTIHFEIEAEIIHLTLMFSKELAHCIHLRNEGQ